ncbi:hypothetical protein VIGAN_08285600, partial [Vigna angularis var. angularis]
RQWHNIFLCEGFKFLCITQLYKIVQSNKFHANFYHNFLLKEIQISTCHTLLLLCNLKQKDKKIHIMVLKHLFISFNHKQHCCGAIVT